MFLVSEMAEHTCNLHVSPRCSQLAGVRYIGGFGMSVTTPEGPRPVRVVFTEPVADAGAVRAQMVSLVQLASDRLGGSPRS